MPIFKGKIVRKGDQKAEDEWEGGSAYELPTVRLPSRDLVLARHSQMDRVDHHAVPRRLRSGRRGRDTIRGIQETLIVARVVLLMEPGGKAEIRQLDVSVLVNQNIIRFDVSVRKRCQRLSKRK
jgi:hypothetical protein